MLTVKERKEYDKVSTQYFKYRNGPNAMVYPLEPIGGELSLQSYFRNAYKRKIEFSNLFLLSK